MKSLVSLSAVLALALSTGCVTTQITEHAQKEVVQRYKGQARELTVSMWATSFFVESSRKLLSVEPPDEVELLDDTHGKPIIPGEAQEVIPAGTKVRIVSITFPGSWSNLTRELETPRDRTWVQLAVEGRPAKPTYMLVLRPDLKDETDVAGEIDKWLTDKPLDAEIAKLSPADRKVITTKELSAGPTARGLELAFGTPHLKKIMGDGHSVTEDWTWQSDTASRSAHLKDGVVTSVSGPPVKHDTTVASHP